MQEDFEWKHPTQKAFFFLHFNFLQSRGSEMVIVPLLLLPSICFQGPCLGDEEIAQFAMQKRRCQTQGTGKLRGPAPEQKGIRARVDGVRGCQSTVWRP